MVHPDYSSSMEGGREHLDGVLLHGIMSLRTLAQQTRLGLPDDLGQICEIAGDLVSAIEQVGAVEALDCEHVFTPNVREDLICTLRNEANCRAIGLHPQDAQNILLLMRQVTKHAILTQRQRHQQKEGEIALTPDCVIPLGHSQMPREWNSNNASSVQS